MGLGVGTSMECVYWAKACPSPLDPSTELRMSGPTSLDSGSEAGMTEGKGEGPH